ncbi:hypothetical protein TNCV_4966261, partial [Trichonephila clavipes]
PQKQVGRIDVSAATSVGRYGSCSVLGNSGSQKVECTVAEGQDVPGTQNDREDHAIRRVATSAPTTSLASIQRHLPPSRHPVPSRKTIRETTDQVGEEPTSQDAYH